MAPIADLLSLEHFGVCRRPIPVQLSRVGGVWTSREERELVVQLLTPRGVRRFDALTLPFLDVAVSGLFVFLEG